jgi:nucleotide-binding universal stress UspA family protein
LKLRYSKILVLYDGSKYAEKALDHAVNIAKFVKGSEIIIINVMEEILTPPEYFHQEFGIIRQGKIQHYRYILEICRQTCDIRRQKH